MWCKDDDIEKGGVSLNNRSNRIVGTVVVVLNLQHYIGRCCLSQSIYMLRFSSDPCQDCVFGVCAAAAAAAA